MIPVNIVVTDGDVLKEAHHVPSQFLPQHTVPVVTTGPQRHGVFRAVTSTTQTTTEIAAPLARGAIVVTDLLVTTNKKTAGVLTIRFSDGSNIINIGVFPVDLAVNQSIAFVGLFRGWRDAALQMVTTGATFDATVTAGYMKVPGGLEFAVWDALR
jgi:hypothetical protein